MNNEQLQASEIIELSCCGQMLDVPVFELVKKVKLLEEALRTCQVHHVMNDFATPRITKIIMDALNES